MNAPYFPCPLCAIPDAECLFVSPLVRVVSETLGASKGHALIIPTRHFAELIETSKEEHAAYCAAMTWTKDYLCREFNPQKITVVAEGTMSKLPANARHAFSSLIPIYDGAASPSLLSTDGGMLHSGSLGIRHYTAFYPRETHGASCKDCGWKGTLAEAAANHCPRCTALVWIHPPQCSAAHLTPSRRHLN